MADVFAHGSIADAKTESLSDVATSAQVLLFNIIFFQQRFYALAATRALEDTVNGMPAEGMIIASSSLTSSLRSLSQQFADEKLAISKRLQIALGGALIQGPELNLSMGGGSAISRLATHSGLAQATFDPFRQDTAFLLVALYIEDVGVALARSLCDLLKDPSALDYMVGILGALSGQAAGIRALLFKRVLASPGLAAAVDQLSRYRGSLEGDYPSETNLALSPFTIPVGPRSGEVTTTTSILIGGVSARIVESGSNVLNILFLDKDATRAGGFFPNGVGGSINKGISL